METEWSQVLLVAQEDGSDVSRRALKGLCTPYLPALSGILRWQGQLSGDVEDLAQGFCAQPLGKNAVACANTAEGRFRRFRLGSVKRFLADEHRHVAALKRGRGQVVIAPDFAAVEQRNFDEVNPALSSGGDVRSSLGFDGAGSGVCAVAGRVSHGRRVGAVRFFEAECLGSQDAAPFVGIENLRRLQASFYR